MSRRARWLLLAGVAVAVSAVLGGYAGLALTGGDAPPPPRLSDRSAAAGAADTAGRWRPLPAAGTFVGYRVDEEYLGVGVRAAVGRTAAVTGVVEVASGRLRAATLRADLRSLRSDQARRDDALRTRAIETDRYRTARFRLSRPVALAATARPVTGVLELHGHRAGITVQVSGRRRADGRLELVGSAPIRFADFGIEPPSVAGIVTVRDHGLLEFRLVLERA
jgi:polyisoprenoid-binding protein YceI